VNATREAGVGAWFVSEAERETYAQLKAGWNRLLEWGVGDKLPHVREDLNLWRDFSSRWDHGDEDPDGERGLLYHSLRLKSVQEEAESYDRERGGTFVADDQVHTPDPEKEHEIAQAIDQAAEELEKAGVPLPNAGTPASVAEHARAAADSARKGWEQVPTGYKVAGGAAVVGIAAFAVGKAASALGTLVSAVRGGPRS